MLIVPNLVTIYMKIGSYPLKYTKAGSFSQRSVLGNPRMLKARFIVKEQFFFFFLLSFSEEVESKDMLQCYFQVPKHNNETQQTFYSRNMSMSITKSNCKIYQVFSCFFLSILKLDGFELYWQLCVSFETYANFGNETYGEF